MVGDCYLKLESWSLFTTLSINFSCLNSLFILDMVSGSLIIRHNEYFHFHFINLYILISSPFLKKKKSFVLPFGRSSLLRDRESVYLPSVGENKRLS